LTKDLQGASHNVNIAKSSASDTEKNENNIAPVERLGTPQDINSATSTEPYPANLDNNPVMDIDDPVKISETMEGVDISNTQDRQGEELYLELCTATAN
jgi:hypothetical protein